MLFFKVYTEHFFKQGPFGCESNALPIEPLKAHSTKPLNCASSMLRIARSCSLVWQIKFTKCSLNTSYCNRCVKNHMKAGTDFRKLTF
jgi:hypothetical protein